MSNYDFNRVRLYEASKNMTFPEVFIEFFRLIPKIGYYLSGDHYLLEIDTRDREDFDKFVIHPIIDKLGIQLNKTRLFLFYFDSHSTGDLIYCESEISKIYRFYDNDLFYDLGMTFQDYVLDILDERLKDIPDMKLRDYFPKRDFHFELVANIV